MKPLYRSSVFASLFFVFLGFYWPQNMSESTHLVRENLTSTKELKHRSTPRLTFYTTLNQPGGRQVAPTIRAPGVFPRDRYFKEETPESQAVGLPLVEKAPTFSYHSYSKGLRDFITQVVNEQSRVLRGVYVEDVLALPVVQQPAEEPLFVGTLLGTVTQFQSAAQAGVIGLLAHNYLSGKLFYELEIDQEVNLIFGDGLVSLYLITDIQSYQKLAGDLNNSHYVNLENGEKLSTPELYKRMYTGGDKVTFQTCIKKGGDWSWGRIFILATPIPGG